MGVGVGLGLGLGVGVSVSVDVGSVFFYCGWVWVCCGVSVWGGVET